MAEAVGTLDLTHPNYDERKDDWVQMRDLYKGERQVKSKGETYLPATQGMKLDGMGTKAPQTPSQGISPSSLGRANPGQEAYNAYRVRAVFPDLVKQAVESYIGLLHSKPPTIDLPTALEPLREKSSIYAEPLDLLLRRINEEQLVSGRLGLLLDLPEKPDPANPIPYIALYIAEAVRNWDDDLIAGGKSNLNLVVLDESGFKRRDMFLWLPAVRYRVLMLSNLKGETLNPQLNGDSDTNIPDAPGAAYMMAAFENDGGGIPAFDMGQMTTPTLRGQTLNEIPFVFVNTKDIVPTPDEPPLMGLGQHVLAIYRGEADFRQNLFMQGQDTLVITGERRTVATDNPDDGAPLRTGAGSVIELETGGDAKYVGVESQGLAEQKSALDTDYKRAENRAGQLVDITQGGDAESGVALQTRVAAQTATLNQIALTGAAALEKILKLAAQWMGANPDEVKVTPNLEFASIELTGQNLVQLMTAKNMGAPLSLQSIHALMVDKGLTKMEYQEEKDTIEEEMAALPPPGGTTAGGAPGAQPGKPGAPGAGGPKGGGLPPTPKNGGGNETPGQVIGG